jgi:hypothetical protein
MEGRGPLESSSEPKTARTGAAVVQRLIHHPRALPISAVFRLRYVHTLVRKWAHAADGMVIGADGDSTVRSGFSGGAKRGSRCGMPCPCQLCLIEHVQPD